MVVLILPPPAPSYKAIVYLPELVDVLHSIRTPRSGMILRNPILFAPTDLLLKMRSTSPALLASSADSNNLTNKSISSATSSWLPGPSPSVMCAASQLLQASSAGPAGGVNSDCIAISP